MKEVGGVLGAELPVDGGWGLGAKPPAAEDMGSRGGSPSVEQFFNNNNTFLCIFPPK